MDVSEINREYEKLPKNVVPTHYDLYIKPNLISCSFEGRVTVHVQVNDMLNHKVNKEYITQLAMIL